jgi:peptidoglycan/xylan/chitin deacetylase (PgdA/CDA1 family)
MRTLKARLKKMPWSAAEQEVARLEESLEVEASAPSGVHEFMSWDDARHLQAQGFSLGAHTVNHAILSRVGLDEAEQEILASRNRIQEMLGACSNVFCYPNGKRSDYSGETTAFCAKHFQAALSAELGYAQASDLFELKRIPVDNATTVSRLARLLLEAY